MNPASGPDYLRMEKYNPHPPPSARAEQDRAPLFKPTFNVSKMRVKTEKAILKSYKRARRLPPDPKQLERAVAVALRLPLPCHMPPKAKAVAEEAVKIVTQSPAPLPLPAKGWKPTPPHHKPVPATEPHAKQCAVCDQFFRKASYENNHHVTRHHVFPCSEHGRLRAIKRMTRYELSKTVWICWECHSALHRRFTNYELAESPWEETRFLMRNTCAPSVVP